VKWAVPLIPPKKYRGEGGVIEQGAGHALRRILVRMRPFWFSSAGEIKTRPDRAPSVPTLFEIRQLRYPAHGFTPGANTSAIGSRCFGMDRESGMHSTLISLNAQDKLFHPPTPLHHLAPRPTPAHLLTLPLPTLSPPLSPFLGRCLALTAPLLSRAKSSTLGAPCPPRALLPPLTPQSPPSPQH
jgi:hypothetical protein